MKNIYLIGFMATGKTVVGKALAKRLDKRFVDLDVIIEEKEKIAVVDIFAKKGEPYFRALEKAAVKEIAQRDSCIVACGGGVVIDAENVVALKESGVIICLTADVDTILARSRDTQQRPLLNVENPQGRIAGLLQQREQFYRQADFAIDTTSLSVEAVADRIVALLKKKENIV